MLFALFHLDHLLQFFCTHRHGAMEENSLATVAMHLNRFQKTLGERFPVQDLAAMDLQNHGRKHGVYFWASFTPSKFGIGDCRFE